MISTNKPVQIYICKVQICSVKWDKFWCLQFRCCLEYHQSLSVFLNCGLLCWNKQTFVFTNKSNICRIAQRICIVSVAFLWVALNTLLFILDSYVSVPILFRTALASPAPLPQLQWSIPERYGWNWQEPNHSKTQWSANFVVCVQDSLCCPWSCWR